MALWTWWPGDPLGPLASPDDFTATPSADRAELVALTGLPREEIEARFAAGHRCSVAYLGSVAAAYGWVAGAEASIGELDVSFRLTGADRYLWDFQTLPEWRGRGLYPRLLQRILWNEGLDEARFWIINAPENLASARGIQKAGFRVVGDLAFAQDDGRAGLVPATDHDRAAIGAGLLGVPLIQATTSVGVSPCWCCIIAALREGGQAACWPTGTLQAMPCSCRRPDVREAPRQTAL
jgi:GNAT superfamily N-acetyltransferase